MSEGFILYTGRRKDTVYRAWECRECGTFVARQSRPYGQDVRAGKPFDWSWFQEQRSQVDRANHLSTCQKFIEKHRKGPSRTAPCPTTSPGASTAACSGAAAPGPVTSPSASTPATCICGREAIVKAMTDGRLMCMKCGRWAA